MSRASGLTLAAALLCGCGYTELHEAVLRPTTGPSAKVDLYLGEQSPGRPFYEVALVQVTGYGSDADVEALSGALKARGQALGCDALVRARFDLGRSAAVGYGVCVKWAAVASADTVGVQPAVPPRPPSSAP